MSDAEKEPWPLFESGLNALNLPLDAAQRGMFQAYLSLLLEWNEKMNLTAVRDPAEIIEKHFIDSLSLTKCVRFPEHASLVDVGSGAGFPGLPLKIAFSSLRVTFLDSLQKRLTFLDAVIRTLALKDVRTLHARAEDAGRSREEREAYDFAAARAVAPLPLLSELCLPLVKPGGLFLAMKGPDAAGELDAARRAIGTLGARVREVRTFSLPGTDIGRSVVMIEKHSKTPPSYPRNAAKMKAHPL